MAIRQLRPGEALPDGEPRRYKADHGYIRLRWRVGPGQYVEVYEHRVDGDRVTTAEQVHHRNHVRDDNRAENLAPLTAAEHRRMHESIHGDAVVTAYLAGEPTTTIAARHGLHQATVLRLQRVRGVQARPSYSYHPPLDRDLLIRLHSAGARTGQMVEALGVSKERIRRALTLLGLPLPGKPGRPPRDEPSVRHLLTDDGAYQEVS